MHAKTDPEKQKQKKVFRFVKKNYIWASWNSFWVDVNHHLLTLLQRQNSSPTQRESRKKEKEKRDANGLFC